MKPNTKVLKVWLPLREASYVTSTQPTNSMISTLIKRLIFASRPMNTQDWLVVGVTLLVGGGA